MGRVDSCRDASSFVREGLDEALALIKNEFQGLDAHQQYHNAFSRLLKRDPLRRVPMLGTDQRDLFVPELRKAIASAARAGGRIFDIGCGDGQTFSLVASDIPNDVSVDFLDPNPQYIEAFKQTVVRESRLRLGQVLLGGYPEIFADSAVKAHEPEEGSMDLVLAIHVLYFFDQLERCLIEIYKYLKPGAKAFIVFADEGLAFTGQVARAYYANYGRIVELQTLNKNCAERTRLFIPGADGKTGIEQTLERVYPASRPKVTSMYQNTRLYGHSVSDLIALCSIAELGNLEDLSKFDAAAQVLGECSTEAGLRIETEGIRTGMISVMQPQVVVSIQK